MLGMVSGLEPYRTYIVTQKGTKRYMHPLKTHLDNGEAEHGRGDVADQHAGESGNEHVGQQHGPRLRAGLAEDEGGDALVDLALGQGGGQREAAEEEHDDGRPHGGEDEGAGSLGPHALARIIRVVAVLADDVEDDA